MLEAIIIAGDYDQYRHYIESKNLDLRLYRYISREEQLRGLHNVKVRFIGTWWLNPIAKNDELNRIRSTGASLIFEESEGA